MTKAFFTFLLVLSCTCLLAQPSSGFKGGVNWTSHSAKGSISKYSPELGWQLGYAWSIPAYKNISIRTELVFEKNAYAEQWTQYENISPDGGYIPGDFIGYGSKMPLEGYYLNLPLGVNYLFKNRYYVTAGYQLGYSLYDIMADRVGPQWAHACFFGGGSHFKYFDVDVRYVIQCNEDVVGFSNVPQEDGSFIPKQYYTGKNNILQVSLIVPLRWKD